MTVNRLIHHLETEATRIYLLLYDLLPTEFVSNLCEQSHTKYFLNMLLADENCSKYPTVVCTRIVYQSLTSN